jgi:hypothetical protein
MATQVRVLDVVALTADLPARGLVRGQVGTVVEQLSPEVFEVEFSDDSGMTYALCPVSSEQMLVLHHEPAQVA